MTTTLAAYHAVKVAVQVLDEHIDGDTYERKIILTPSGSSHVIEVGVVRINLGYTSREVRAEILRRAAPLGDILIRHNVLRRIEPRWYLRFDPHGPIPAAFDRQLSGPVYGRLGTIYCDDAPAIELLEVVDADKVRSSP